MPDGRADDHARAVEAPAHHLAHEGAQHRLGDLEVGDHAVAQRPVGGDRGRRAADHLLGVGADGVDLARALVDGDHGRLGHDDALSAHEHDGVGRAEVDGDVAATSERREPPASAVPTHVVHPNRRLRHTCHVRRLLLVLALSLLLVPSAEGATLRAGAGQADITPQTGYYLGGWTRADRSATASARGCSPTRSCCSAASASSRWSRSSCSRSRPGCRRTSPRALADRGFDRTSVLLAASHTHSGPGGFANNPTYNTAAPSPETIGDPRQLLRVPRPGARRPRSCTRSSCSRSPSRSCARTPTARPPRRPGARRG